MTPETSTPRPTTLTFAVEGMSCGSCVRHIGEVLTKNFELIDHQVDLAAKKLTVTFTENSADPEALARMMSEEGYPITRI